ncbi:hypothetical protein SBADM41S_04479 [Streptomyces badius]
MGGLPGRRHQGCPAAPRRVPDAPLAAGAPRAPVCAAQAAGNEYVNTIPTAAEPAFDGDLEMESKITAWNSLERGRRW